MDYKEQLEDSGAVIGYKPNLKLKDKQIKSEIDTNGQIFLNEYYTKDIKKYSKLIQEYLSNTPGSVISNINEVKETISDITERLIEEFLDIYPDVEIQDFIFNIKNGNDVTDFMLEYQNINGSIIPEILKVIIEEEKFLNKLENDLKEIYYGDSFISNDDIEEIDKKIKNQITANDLGESGNNYLLLAKDGIMNKIINIFTDEIDNDLYNLEDILNEDNTGTADKDFKHCLETMYDKLTKQQETRESIYKQQHLNLDTTTKSLYNYYNKRKFYNTYYTNVISSNHDSEYLNSKIEEFEEEVDKALIEINKTFMANQYYMSKIDEILTEKQNLLALSATISYN